MKKLFLPLLVSSLFANNLCVDVNHIKAEKLVKYEKMLLSYYIPKNKAYEIINKELFFAKKYLKLFPAKSKNIFILGGIKALSEAYRNYLIKKYSPNDEVIKSFYMEYKNSFLPSVKVDISTIKVKSVELADEIYKKLKKNPSLFYKMAKKYSIDNDIKYVNLPLDKFAFNVRNFLEHAKVGEISKPLKVGNFYYIDKIDKKEHISVKYKDIKPQIKKLLVNIYVNKLMKKMYEDAQ